MIRGSCPSVEFNFVDDEHDPARMNMASARASIGECASHSLRRVVDCGVQLGARVRLQGIHTLDQRVPVLMNQLAAGAVSMEIPAKGPFGG